MKFTINWLTTLRELIIAKDPNLLEKLNPRRITGSDAVSYGILVHYVSWSVFVETLVWEDVSVVYEWLPIHDLKTLSMDIAKLQRIWILEQVGKQRRNWKRRNSFIWLFAHAR